MAFITHIVRRKINVNYPPYLCKEEFTYKHIGGGIYENINNTMDTLTYDELILQGYSVCTYSYNYYSINLNGIGSL